jgi:hypothetical protein
MIKGIQGSAHVVVTGGNTSLPFVNANINNPMTGMIRIHGTDMQVFDGSGWLSMSTSYATVALSPTTEEAINWVKYKMLEEKNLHERMERHPGLKDAYEKFRIMDVLTLEENNGAELAGVDARHWP